MDDDVQHFFGVVRIAAGRIHNRDPALQVLFDDQVDLVRFFTDDETLLLGREETMDRQQRPRPDKTEDERIHDRFNIERDEHEDIDDNVLGQKDFWE